MNAQMDLPLHGGAATTPARWVDVTRRISSLNMEIATALGDGNHRLAATLSRELTTMSLALRDIACHLHAAPAG